MEIFLNVKKSPGLADHMYVLHNLMIVSLCPSWDLFSDGQYVIIIIRQGTEMIQLLYGGGV